ncbi:MAG: hypothetical protein ABSA76_10810 [Bacteroidales bacterium]
MKNDLMVNAQKLGIKVDLDSNAPKPIDESGKQVRKTPEKPNKEKIEAQKLLSEYPPEFQQHVNDVLETNPDFRGVLIPLTPDQRIQAYNDIKANKKSAASLSTLNALEHMWKTHGGIDVWEDVSKTKVTLSPKDIQDAKDELLADKNKAELDKYSYEDIDKALKDGLITKDEYDGIKDYVTESARASEEAGAAEENFLAANYGDNEGGTEKGEAKPEEVKPEYWTKDEVPKNTLKKTQSLHEGYEKELNSPELKKTFLREQNGKKVYIVNNDFIKRKIDPNFTEGGNEMVYYPYVPKGEIWVSDDVAEDKRDRVIGHEMWEEWRMSKGKEYSNDKTGAHEEANKMEVGLRNFEAEQLKPKGGKITDFTVTDKGIAFKYKETPDGEEKEKTMFPDEHMEDGHVGKDIEDLTENKPNEKPTNEPDTPTGKGKEDNIPAGAESDKGEATPKGEEKPIEPKSEKPKQGVKFKDKVYQTIDEVQDDFADGKLNKKEEQVLREKVYEVTDVPGYVELSSDPGVIDSEYEKLKPEREAKLIEDLKSIPTQKISMKERLQGIKDKISKFAPKNIDGRIKNSLTNLKENAKAVWKAYSGMPEWTDYRKALGDWSLAKQINDKALMDFTKLAEKKIPLRSRREAIVNYIEADGDVETLKKREESSKANHKQGYKDAQNLTPDEIKIANSIKDYFDSMLKMGFDAGILKSQVENYVTHFGVRPDDPKVTKVIGGFDNGKLNTNFKYARGRIFKTFFDLEQAGFRADKDFKDIIPAYSKGFARTLYSRAFVKNMTEGNASDGRPIVAQAGMGSVAGDENISKAALVNPYAKSEDVSDYRYVNHPSFRDWYWATKAPDGTNVFAKGELVVHPDYATRLSNILGKSDLMKSVPLRKITKGVNVTKQTIFMLSPFFHYIQEGFHAIGHTVNPIWGLKEFNPEDVTHQKLIKGGLQLYDFQAKSNFAEGLASLNIAGKIPIIKDTILPLQEYLFNEYIPKLKITTAEHMLNRNLKKYSKKYSDDQIYALSADQANVAYGNLNYDLIGRNPTMQHIFRTMALAPDFLEARTKFVGQALTPKGAEQRRALIILGGTLFVASRLLNKLFDDDYHWDKPFSFVYKKNEYTMRSVPEDM